MVMYGLLLMAICRMQYCNSGLVQPVDTVMPLQAQLQAASPESGDLCSADLPKTKEIAEQAIQHYLKVASTILEGKLEALPTQRQHRTNILQQLLSARLSITMPELSNIPSWSTAEVQQHNEAQLQASLVLSAAFDDTRKARAHLQHCLDKESCLMESRNSPLQQGLTQSAHLMQHTIAALQQQDLDEDQQQAEAMLRCTFVLLRCMTPWIKLHLTFVSRPLSLVRLCVNHLNIWHSTYLHRR